MKRVRLSTVEEQEMNNYRHRLSLTPEQRIAEATQIITQVYGNRLTPRLRSNRIIFDERFDAHRQIHHSAR